MNFACQGVIYCKFCCDFMIFDDPLAYEGCIVES